MKKTIPILLLLLLICGLTQTYAQDMSNDDLILEIDPTKSKTTPSITPKPTHNISPAPVKDQSIKMNVSENKVEFGKLHPGEPILRELGITTQSSNGSQVFIYEDNSPKDEKNVLQDTTCDQGTCTENIEANWSNPLTYGFGYQCQGKGCIFSPQNSLFRQFSNHSLSEPAVLFSKTYDSEESPLRMVMKVNIPQNLKDTQLKNKVYILALPLLEEK